MHCDDPTCAEVCPADAIKKGEDGVVQSALKPRCIACNNCVLACPFGIPKMMTKLELMMKCDMCYDRTSVGKRPMCATVCPSQALAYVPSERIAREGAAAALASIPAGGPAYVTIDIDVLDPSGAPGTGYPEPGGINYYQLKEALLLVAARYDVIGFDLTEVDPVYDTAGVTSRIAAKLILDFLGGVFGK
jgi:Fe-S-cluster-containing dehydrogenase component